ncbi:MAG TPA: hypothetical protein VFC19_15635 [Candidatus Limnocylindrales bacterium]|nr:hypothetical protein [Candidatus Limnocylindrales bacterium]
MSLLERALRLLMEWQRHRHDLGPESTKKKDIADAAQLVTTSALEDAASRPEEATIRKALTKIGRYRLITVERDPR